MSEMLISNTNRGRYSGCAQESDNDKNNGMYKPRCNRTFNLWNKKFGPQPYKNHLLHVHADDFGSAVSTRTSATLNALEIPTTRTPWGPAGTEEIFKLISICTCMLSM